MNQFLAVVVGSCVLLVLVSAETSNKTLAADNQKVNSSLSRQNFDLENEDGINKQINIHMRAALQYASMSIYFDRSDVFLKGFSKFFKELNGREWERAEKLMMYQNLRGGRVMLSDVKKPEKDEWGSGLEAMEAALQLEKNVNQHLIDLNAIAAKHNDYQMQDKIKGGCLKVQVHSIKKIADHIMNLKRVGPGLGEYEFDKHTLGH